MPRAGWVGPAVAAACPTSKTIEVLSDPELMRDLQDREPVAVGIDAIRALVAERTVRERP